MTSWPSNKRNNNLYEYWPDGLRLSPQTTAVVIEYPLLRMWYIQVIRLHHVRCALFVRAVRYFRISRDESMYDITLLVSSILFE